ncbi:MAG: hypothetical protein ACI4VB_05225, partial [Bradymonadia bacterium]
TSVLFHPITFCRHSWSGFVPLLFYFIQSRFADTHGLASVALLCPFAYKSPTGTYVFGPRPRRHLTICVIHKTHLGGGGQTMNASSPFGQR